MKRSRKLTLFTLIVLFVVTCVMGLVACGGKGAKEAIEMYILPQAETLVSEDFTLPKKIGKDGAVEVKWTSSNEDAIKVEDNGGEEYNAKVTLQSEVTDVTLTIKAGSHKKNFTVRVDALTVSTFVEHYEFPYFNSALKAGEYDLATSVEVQGQTATITWTVAENSKNYISLNESGSKLTVGSVDERVSVSLQAKFTYGGQDANRTYAFYAAPNTTHLQDINAIYSNDGGPLEFSGYIVYLCEASASYGNATFYMIDDDFCSGYYMYRVKIDTEKVDKYVVGAHVTVTGATTKNYNGVWENNSNGTATVDEDKAPIDPRDHIYDFDTDAISDAPSALWHESTLVRLSGWQLSKASSKPAGDKTATMFTLKQGDTQVTVAFNSYMKYDNNAILGIYDTVEDGAYYTVVGLLSSYNGKYQLVPYQASDVTKVDEAVTNEDGAKIKAAVAAVDTKVKAEFSSLIVDTKTVTMPVANIENAEGVTVSYEVAGVANPTVEIDNTTGSFTITPIQQDKNYEIMATYTLGSYKAYSFFKLRNWDATPAELVSVVAKNVRESTMDKIVALGTYDFPSVDLIGCTIEWAVKEGSPAWATVVDNKLQVTDCPAEGNVYVHLVATVKAFDDSATETAEITVRVEHFPFVAASDMPKTGDYVFALYQATIGKWMFMTGEVNSSKFGVSTEDVSAAAVFTIAESGSGYSIKVKSGVNEGKYLSLDNNNKIQFVDTEAVWTWNSSINAFTFDVKGTSYYIGTYGTFDTFSASKTSYATSKGNFIAQFGTKN